MEILTPSDREQERERQRPAKTILCIPLEGIERAPTRLYSRAHIKSQTILNRMIRFNLCKVQPLRMHPQLCAPIPPHRLTRMTADTTIIRMPKHTRLSPLRRAPTPHLHPAKETIVPLNPGGSSIPLPLRRFHRNLRNTGKKDLRREAQWVISPMQLTGDPIPILVLLTHPP